ncbi:MAG: hypothetical protein J4F35_19580 [Candidatus Latescibacteria bacterium]|nr:hypothetical protein [Candidatus Latescibacterota bacterium]
MHKCYLIVVGAVLCVLSWSAPTLVGAQAYDSRMGRVKQGGKVDFSPQGPGVLFDALDPAVRKWYVPQELYQEYQWRQWEYSNYAREPYQRYVDTALEGDFFYDFFGNLVTRGWLIYDWQQDRPRQFGSSILKTNRFNQWFSKVAVSSDHKGQYYYSITIGDEIRTTLTPMTFSKPTFNTSTSALSYWPVPVGRPWPLIWISPIRRPASPTYWVGGASFRLATSSGSGRPM